MSAQMQKLFIKEKLNYIKDVIRNAIRLPETIPSIRNN